MLSPIMGNTDKNKTKKFRRKIRIRLSDPNVPDSYICEIFDSSLENEDDDFSKNNSSQKEEEGPSKPRNYFEILMSKSCKRNGVISTAKDNERYKTKNDNNEKVIQKRKQKKNAKSNSLTQSVDVKRKEIKDDSDSSENESLLEIQTKSKVDEFSSKEEGESEKGIKTGDEVESDDLICIFDTKGELPVKKTLSILNYFSKAENNSNKALKCKKLESNSAKTSKTCQANNKPKQSRSESEKVCQNTDKKVLKGINKENKKLAPLFRSRETHAADLVKQKARHEFLYRELPSAKKLETKSPEILFYFPKVTHVQQRNENVNWTLREIKIPLQKVLQSECVFNGIKKFSLEVKCSNAVNNEVTENTVNCTNEVLCKMKCKYLELDLGLVIDGLKDKQEKFLARVEEVGKSEGDVSCDEAGWEEPNSLWTEKYKPKSSEILGNGSTVRRLRRWLESWKAFDDELKVLAKNSQSSKSREESDDDADEFLNLNSENYGLKAPGNVCIVSGPNGCGKTALVYALANELEFGVLELNASSKRTGKKVLTNLQEATQSHKVHRANPLQNFPIQAEPKKKKSRKVKKKGEESKMSDQANECRISLILIEDADIVFDDHDEGFHSAITSLVQTSKRPLIFLANEPYCPYLENLKLDQCLILEMEPPNFYKSCAVLDVVSSLEGVRFEREVLESLVRQNSFDLRKSLLELQFWSRPGRRVESVQTVFDLGHLWWGLSKFLFKQDIKHFARSKARKRKRGNDLFDSSDDETETVKKFKSDPESSKAFCRVKVDPIPKARSSIEAHFRVLDLMSALDGFGLSGSEEPVPGFECRAKDSLALEENMEEVMWSSGLSEQLSREMLSLSGRIFVERSNGEEREKREMNSAFPRWEEVRWRNSQMRASEELSNIVSLQRGTDKRSLYLDYLPLLRSICRIERHRAEINPKRKNRFYHYLNNLGSKFTEDSLDINCEIFER